jgi:hypothetical protein
MTFGVAAIRAFAKARAEATSLHAVAAEIPMSYTAFRHFLQGGKPQAATVAKLIAWYGECRQGGDSSEPSEDVEAALVLLIRFIGQARSGRGARKRFQLVTGRIVNDPALRDYLAPDAKENSKG